MYESLMDKFGFMPFNHEAPVFFPVEIAHVYSANQKERGEDKFAQIPGYKAVMRMDTGDVLKIHTSKYTLVKYEESFKAFEDAIYASGLDTTDMRIATDMMNNGGKIYRQYLFPNVTEEIKPGRVIALRISMFDSYDGSCSFFGYSGFFDFECANMARMGRTALEIRVKHVGDAAERQLEAIKLIVEAADRFVAEAKRMKAWPKIRFNPIDLRFLLMNGMPQCTEQLADTLLAAYAVEQEHNLWTLYSCLTYWATHTPDGKSKKMSVDRQKRILDLIEGKEWKMLESE